MAAKTSLTVADLERMPDIHSRNVELDEGELIEIAAASEDHGNLELEIAFLLKRFAKEHDLGRVYAGYTGFRLNDGTLRSPDVAFLRKARVEQVRSTGFENGAPDLAVEIFSPSDSVAQLMRKVKQYFAAGTHTVWIVYPERREIHALEASGADRILQAADIIDAQELLPGFSTPIAAVLRRGTYRVEPRPQGRGPTARRLSEQTPGFCSANPHTIPPPTHPPTIIGETV